MNDDLEVPMKDLVYSVTGIPEITEEIHNSSYNTESSRGDVHVSDDLKMIVVAALFQDQDIDDSKIKVNIKPHGWIELTGTVPKESMIYRANRCIRELGHVDIENRLSVEVH
jgi:osmotically-inducible protein OsmY